MKKIYFLILLVCSMFFFAGCGSKDTKDAAYTISYINKDMTRIEEVAYEPKLKDAQGMMQEFLTMLQTNPESVDYTNAIPENVVVNTCDIKDAQISLDVSEEYYLMDVISEILCRAAIVRTMTQIEDVQCVSITVDGTPLKDANGDVVGAMSSDSFIENPGEQINAIQASTITLYFTNKAGDKLVKETDEVYETSNISMEKLVMEHLLEAPRTSGYRSTIPAGTQLVSVSVLDGVCFVNLDEGFLNQDYTVAEDVVIYSIVNSLTELPTVNKVQISVNGDTSKVYREKYAFETLYERNLDLVVLDEKESSETEGEGVSDN